MTSPRSVHDRRAGRRGVLALLAVAAVAGWVSDSGAAGGLALLAVATAPAVFAVPPRGRVLLGLVVIVAAGLAAVVSSDDADLGSWSASAALTLAGALLVWRGPTWPAWSQRYERAAPGSPGTPAAPDLWKALDRGEDPTRDSPEP